MAPYPQNTTHVWYCLCRRGNWDVEGSSSRLKQGDQTEKPHEVKERVRYHSESLSKNITILKIKYQLSTTSPVA